MHYNCAQCLSLQSSTLQRLRTVITTASERMAVSPAESGILGDYLAWVAVILLLYCRPTVQKYMTRYFFSPFASWESYRRCHHIEQILNQLVIKNKSKQIYQFQDATFSLQFLIKRKSITAMKTEMQQVYAAWESKSPNNEEMKKKNNMCSRRKKPSNRVDVTII